MNYFKRMSKVNIRNDIIDNKKYIIDNYEDTQLEWYKSMKAKYKEEQNNEENNNTMKNEIDNNKIKNETFYYK